MPVTWIRGRHLGWTTDAAQRWWVIRARRRPFAPWDVMICDRDGMQRAAGGFFTRRGAEKWVEREAKEMPIPGHPDYVVNAIGGIRPLSKTERAQT